jgi:outer membrane protein TolC
MPSRSVLLLFIFLFLWCSPTWGADGNLPHRFVVTPAKIAKTRLTSQEGGVRGQDVHKQEEAQASSRALDLGQIKRSLERFQVQQEKAVPGAEPQPQGQRLELSLQQSIEIALHHNLRLQIATLTREAVQTEIPRAKAKFHPTVGLALIGSGEKSSSGAESSSKTNDLDVNAFISAEAPTGATLALSSNLISQEETAEIESRPRQFDSELVISVVQPLLRGGGIVVATRPIRDAQFDLRVEEARLQAEVLRVTADAKSAYYEMLLAEKIIEVTEEAIARDKTLLEASQALFEAGLVTKRDVFSAEISLAKDSARLVRARASLESAKNTLLDVLGIPLTRSVFLLDKDISLQPVPLELARWIAVAMDNRPEIMEIEQELEKRLLKIQVERNVVLPQVDLVASYERFEDNSSVSKAFGFSGEAWSAGLVFSVPIGNVAAKSALARTKIEHVRLQQRLVQTRRRIELEVRDAVIKLHRSLEGMKALITNVENSQGKLEFARSRFALGLATNFDITDAQEDLLDAETDLLSAIVDYNIGLAELEARIAGPI